MTKKTKLFGTAKNTVVNLLDVVDVASTIASTSVKNYGLAVVAHSVTVRDEALEDLTEEQRKEVLSVFNK